MIDFFFISPAYAQRATSTGDTYSDPSIFGSVIVPILLIVAILYFVRRVSSGRKKGFTPFDKDD